MYKILIKIKNNTTTISINDDNIDEIIKSIDNLCSFTIPNSFFSFLYKNSNWNGKYHFIHNKSSDTIEIPTGLIDDVLNYIFLKFNEEEIYIEYPKVPTKKYQFNDFTKNISVRYYQKESVELLKNNTKFIISLPTGCGKTLTTALIIKELGLNTIVCVPTREILYQTYDNYCNYFGSENIGLLGDGIKKINKITICTIESLCHLKYDLIKELKISEENQDLLKSLNEETETDISKIELDQLITNTEALIVDECHIIPAFSFFNTIMKFENAYYKIGLSATTFRSDGLDMKMFAGIGKIIYHIDTKTLIEKKFLVPAEIHIIDTTIPIDSNLKSFKGIYSREIIHNLNKNTIICDLIYEHKKDNKIMILVDFIEHGNQIINLYQQKYRETLPFLNGNETTKNRKELRTKFEKEFNVLIATTIADIGIDFPFLNMLIMGGGGKSKVRINQRVGRVLRLYPNKEKAIIYDFLDKNKYLFEQSMQRIYIYKNNGFKIISNSKINV